MRLSGFRHFLTELKRRRVFRVAAVYLVVAWLVIQVAVATFPYLNLPPWMVTAIIVLAILGFPVALALGWAFDITPQGVERTEPVEEPGGEARTSRPGLARWVLAGAVVLAVATAGWLGWQRWASAGEANLDSNVVAVLPFRVAGAEPSLGYLREGMLDLLAAKLTGEAGPRAVDPRTLMSAWRRAVGEGGGDLPRDTALELARTLGAGRAVLGEVVSLPGRVVLTASLADVGSGRADAPVSIEGPPDSLPALVDRLVAGLLSVEAGEGERLASLTTTSLPALRQYLEGQAAFRGGRYDEAYRRFASAVETDSTFALAALMLNRVAGWPSGAPPGTGARALALASRHRERLGPRDQVQLAAVAGPNYPDYSSAAERLAAHAKRMQQHPDDPDAWFEWGDAHLHVGAYLDIPDSASLRIASEAFSRTLALDSTFLPALGHLFDIAVMRADTAASRRYGELYLARDPRGLTADLVRNVRAAQTRGLEAIPEILSRTDSSIFAGFYASALLRMNRQTYSLGAALQAQLNSRPEPSGDWNEAAPTNPHTPVIREALYGDGDRQEASAAAEALARRVEGSADGIADPDALCVLGQWRLANSEATAAAPLAGTLRAAGREGRTEAEIAALRCAELLDTWRVAELGGASAPTRIARLDSLLATGPLGGPLTREANLVLARLLEARGDLRGALRVLHRDPIFDTAAFAAYRSTYLRERGRLAALVGDTVGAVEAYSFYLVMRADSEPRLQPEIEQVRAELARLTGGRAR